jgi:hypothetical protein
LNGLRGSETGIGAVLGLFPNKKKNLIASKDILSQEYYTESHRLSSMTRSQDEIKRVADQLDDNDVRMKLQTEIRRLVDRIVLHMKIQKFIIYYHTPKWIFRFKSGKSMLFIESGGELIAYPGRTNTVLFKKGSAPLSLNLYRRYSKLLNSASATIQTAQSVTAY